MNGIRAAAAIILAALSFSLLAAPAKQTTVLITGANRGLGYEFAKQYKADGYHVIATARDPAGAQELKKLNIKVYPLDVTSQKSVDDLAKNLKQEPIDILINNAGVSAPHQSLKNLDMNKMHHVFEVNSFGPIRVTQALLPNLRLGTGKKIINISSQLGSITNNTGTTTESYRYSYRASKSALNQLTKSMANELGKDGFICVALHPGWVRTDMGGPAATYSPTESIQSLIKVINNLKQHNNGEFINLDGSKLPW